MRKKALFQFCLFTIVAAAIFYSCRKETNPAQVNLKPAGNAPEVRKAYESSGLRTKMKQTLKDSLTIHFIADWSQATRKRISDTVAYYYIPLVSFLTNKDGRLEGLKYVAVQHYLVAKETASGYSFFKASYQQNSASREAAGGLRSQEGFSGVLVLDNFSQKSLYKYEKGNVLKRDNSVNGRWICDQECTWFSYCSGADIGSGAYTVTYTWGRAGNSCEYPWTGLPDCGFAGSTPTNWILSGSSEINCTYIDDGTTPPPPPGGGGTEEPVPTFRIADIVNNFTNPCYSQVLQEINNGALTNAISKILVNLYASTDVLDIKFFNEAFTPKTTEGDTRMQAGSAGVIVANVTLNDSALAQNNSSKEYIAATMMHEILHAYMFYKGGTPPVNEHEDMALFYLNTMIEALIDVYPGLERWQAEALAWPGLQQTYAYSEFKRRWPRIAGQEQQLAGQHKTGAVGTLCP